MEGPIPVGVAFWLPVIFALIYTHWGSRSIRMSSFIPGLLLWLAVAFAINSFAEIPPHNERTRDGGVFTPEGGRAAAGVGAALLFALWWLIAHAARGSKAAGGALITSGALLFGAGAASVQNRKRTFPLSGDRVLGDVGNATLYERPDGSFYSLDRNGRGGEAPRPFRVGTQLLISGDDAVRKLPPARFDSRSRARCTWAGCRSHRG